MNSALNLVSAALGKLDFVELKLAFFHRSLRIPQGALINLPHRKLRSSEERGEKLKSTATLAGTTPRNLILLISVDGVKKVTENCQRGEELSPGGDGAGESRGGWCECLNKLSSL